jgi:hypothetical protein
MTRRGIQKGLPRHYAKEGLQRPVIPAEAGIQGFETRFTSTPNWIPASAGMTLAVLFQAIADRLTGYSLHASASSFLQGSG